MIKKIINISLNCTPSFDGANGKEVQVGKDQEKAQSEKDSHFKNQDGKKQTNNQVLIP